MKPNDLFIINNETSFSLESQKVLVLCYLPLLGGVSFSIYMTLQYLTPNMAYKHTEIFDLLNISKETFELEKERLEALGLLETFYNDHDYIYRLKCPLSAHSFFNDTVLGSYLETEIGKKSCQNIVNILKLVKTNTNDYKNITKNFDEVYQVKDIKINNINDLNGYKTNGTSIKQNIDIEKLQNMLTKAKNNDLLENDKLIIEIKKAMFLYQFTYEEMAKIIEDSLGERGVIKIVVLKTNAKKYYEATRNTKTKIEEVRSDEVAYLEKTSPLVVIEQFCAMPVDVYLANELTNLIDEYQISLGFLNALIIYVLKFKKGVLPNKKYFEKIISNLLSRDITKTSEVLVYLKTEKTKNDQTIKNDADWVKEAFNKLLKDEW